MPSCLQGKIDMAYGIGHFERGVRFCQVHSLAQYDVLFKAQEGCEIDENRYPFFPPLLMASQLGVSTKTIELLEVFANRLVLVFALDTYRFYPDTKIQNVTVL